MSGSHLGSGITIALQHSSQPWAGEFPRSCCAVSRAHSFPFHVPLLYAPTPPCSRCVAMNSTDMQHNRWRPCSTTDNCSWLAQERSKVTHVSRWLPFAIWISICIMYIQRSREDLYSFALGQEQIARGGDDNDARVSLRQANPHQEVIPH